MTSDTAAHEADRSVLIPLDVPIIERAFQLARSGQFTRLREIGTRLEGEGYLDVQEHFHDSRLLRQQLRTLVRRAASDRDETENVRGPISPSRERAAIGDLPGG